MKTRTESRLRLREASGKIRGPYTRADIAALIIKKKLSGEEEIFFENEGKWKPIGSDTEFFDLIQEVYFGIQPGTRTTAPKTKIEQSDHWTDSVEKNPSPKTDATQKLGTKVQQSSAQAPITKTVRESGQTRGTEQKKVERAAHKVEEPTREPPEANKQEIQGFDELPPASTAASPAKKRKFFLIAAILLIGIFIFMKMNRNSIQGQDSSDDFDFAQLHYDIQFRKGYFRPLALRMKLFTSVTAPPGALTSDIEQLKSLPFDVHTGMMRWGDIEKKPDWIQSAAAWMERAWILKILGDAVSAADLDHGRELSRAADAIVHDLVLRGAITTEYKQLYAALGLVLGGRINEALALTAKLKILPAKELQREISYWASFDPTTKMASTALSEDDLFDLSSNSQREEALRRTSQDESFEPDFLKKTEAVLRLDSHSLLAWYLLARYNSKAFKGNPQVSNRYYLSGLAVLSLYPRFLQGLYWRSYGQFIGAIGLGDQKRYLKNAELIEKGQFDSSPDALDVDSESFKLEVILQTYRKAFEQNEMNAIELASFEVISELSKNPKDNLFMVLMTPLLDKNFGVIETRLRLLEKTFPYDFDVKTLRVWFESEKYRFDKAEEILRTDFQSAPTQAANEVSRAEGIYFIIGHDYEDGMVRLLRYLTTNPRDALTLYFLARAQVDLENFTECVRFSNLAQLNSTGPLHLRSLIMNLQCRVRAKLSVDDALHDFELLVSRSPQTSVSREEYIRTLLDADRAQDAMKIAEQAVRENPQNVSLKVLLGEVYEKLGMNNEALAVYNEARRLEPSQTKAALHIGDLFFKEKRYNEAAQNYVSAGAQDFELPEIFLKAARSYREIGQFKSAQEMYFKEVELRPAVLETFLEAAEFFLEKNTPNLVPQLFKKFSENFKSDPRVLTRLAQAYFAMGDQQNARTNAELAIRQNPKEPEPYRILGSIFEHAGQYPLAKANYDKYIILLPEAPDVPALRQKMSMSPFSAQ